ncbi:MAG: carboxypeptidase, partial [Armatimonadetes bacterium]|nr:carboxypeptidase [Armatimonadota bacterium]
MPEIKFDRYYRYDALTELLQAFAKEYPKLIEIQEIGKSYEGRPIWMAVVTASQKGAASDKPGFWCDGNIHATEVSASTA